MWWIVILIQKCEYCGSPYTEIQHFIIMYTGSNDGWTEAVDMLVTNAKELMNSIKELLEAVEIDQLKTYTLWSDDGGKYTDRVRLIVTFNKQLTHSCYL